MYKDWKEPVQWQGGKQREHDEKKNCKQQVNTWRESKHKKGKKRQREKKRRGKEEQSKTAGDKDEMVVSGRPTKVVTHGHDQRQLTRQRQYNSRKNKREPPLKSKLLTQKRPPHSLVILLAAEHLPVVHGSVLQNSSLLHFTHATSLWTPTLWPCHLFLAPIFIFAGQGHHCVSIGHQMIAFGVTAYGPVAQFSSKNPSFFR